MSSDIARDHKKDGNLPDSSYATGYGTNSSNVSVGDAATLPTGVLDPVYDAKARILNRAVRIIFSFFFDTFSHEKGSMMANLADLDSRYWHGMVSMAAIHRGRLRMGFR